jgi:plasmid stabilization system protein ParE
LIGLQHFAPRAARDIEDAADWIADNAGGPDVSRRMVQSTLDAAARIVARPQLGRMRPDLLPDRFRFWAVRGFPYLLVYDATRSPPQAVRVLHMARDLPAALTDLDA